MKALSAFLASMAGRIFLILLFGVALSAATALTLAEGKRQADLSRIGMERIADRVQSFLTLWEAASPDGRARLTAWGMAGVRPAPATARALGDNPALSSVISSRLGEGIMVAAQHADFASSCRNAPPPGVRRALPPTSLIAPISNAGPGRVQPPECWLVKMEGGAVGSMTLALETPLRVVGESLILDPLYLAILAAAAAVLAFFVARMAAAPLHALSRAAADLGRNLAREPIPLRGPTEVQAAARAFNAMQTRLRRQLSERTHMLAAITHDLQTPMTRLRLRLEKVEDEALKERLLADLAAMQVLIREGLDLARTAESAEAAVLIDLNSLLQSIVEDAADAGQDVRLVESVPADVRGRPEALRRVLLNLVDNALKYGGSADITAERMGPGGVTVRIRDHGPGLPPEQLETVFDPFVRLEQSRSRTTGGSGLGLTIARMLAEKDGAMLTLRNHPEGGAEAILDFTSV